MDNTDPYSRVLIKGIDLVKIINLKANLEQW